MIARLLERLCAATGHRVPALCASVARDEAYWRTANAACDEHRRLRNVYLAGIADLPFAPRRPTTEHQRIACDVSGGTLERRTI